MRLLQRDLFQQLRDEATATRETLAALIRPLDASQLNAHPEPNGWSVGQVLEHLCVADELNDAPFAALVRDAQRDPDAPSRMWKPSFIGGRIAASLINPKPLKGPKVFRPGPVARDGVVETLLSREANFLQAMENAMSLNWRALRIKSPALPSWAPTLNLGDGFRIHTVHLTRHSHQVERLAAQLQGEPMRH